MDFIIGFGAGFLIALLLFGGFVSIACILSNSVVTIKDEPIDKGVIRPYGQ